jgi:hypothetical protein
MCIRIYIYIYIYIERERERERERELQFKIIYRTWLYIKPSLLFHMSEKLLIKLGINF